MTMLPRLCIQEIAWCQPIQNRRLRRSRTITTEPPPTPAISVRLNTAGSRRQPPAAPGRLPAASVSTAIYVEHLSAHLRCPCKVENSVHNVGYVRHFSHRLQRLKKVLGFIVVHWCVHDARG